MSVVLLIVASCIRERRWTRALRLSSEGLIDREVARITGVSIGAVQKWRTGLRRTPEKELRHANCPRCDGATA